MENEHHLHLNESDSGGILAWNSSMFATEILSSDLNCSTECFFTTSWDPPSLDHNDDLFKSALSSIVSSPVASGAGAGAGDGFVIRELIGRLGSISNSGEISPQPRSSCSNIINIGRASNNNSCYNTPLNSPPKLNLSPVMGGSIIQENLQLPGSYLTSSHPSLAPLNADPGFVERAARFSCFGSGSLLGGGELDSQFWSELGGSSSLPKLEPGKLSRASSNQPVKVLAESLMGGQEKVNSVASGGQLLGRQISPENGEVGGGSREGSSVSELNPPGGQQLGGSRVQNDVNSRKRKPNNTKAKAREDKVGTEGNNNDHSPNAKRMKQDEDAAAKKDKAETQKTNENGKSTTGGGEGEEGGGEKQNGSKESGKPPEPPKDYIHVRARRGQATDSHSLAERVRREKISERMKFLQDLVPGCNKVTGKAVVLDEIINYVQSLQRQVEFLSMKLATVDPQMEYNMEALLSKEVSQSRGMFLPGTGTMYPLDTTTATPQAAFTPYSYQQSHQIPPPAPTGVYTGSENPSTLMTTHSSNTFHQNSTIQMPSTERYSDSAAAQVPTFGGDDLHSIIQMGFNQTSKIEGTKPSTQVKVEI